MTFSTPELQMDAAWQWLTSLSPRGIQLGLERVEAALSRLGNPHKDLVAVTIAGTNGKGSTAAFLASILHTAGYRTALYTSPHLVSVTERIRIGGHTILPSDFARWASMVRDAIEAPPAIPLTLFETLTVMALGYFRERQVDIAVLEVGLGGRLDATNVVDAKVAVLTPVGLDHQDLLGPTKRDICREKIHILKPNATLVCHVAPTLWRDVVGPFAYALRAPARRAGVDFVHTFHEDGFRYRGAQHRIGNVTLGLSGVHQGVNAALACAAAEALGTMGFHLSSLHLAEGLYRARHRGRLERFEPNEGRPATLIDGAHNPMGARVLARHVGSFLPERPRVLLYGVNPDKDVGPMLKALVPLADAVVLTQSTARPVADFGRYERVAKRVGRAPVIAVPNQLRALESASSLAGPEGGLLVTGSLYLLGDLLPHITD
jgi:dihydrofolate synthase/folylpolyglutamate synthase